MTPQFRIGPVLVRPPATSANLGPGFDSFGLALELRDEVTVEVFDSPTAPGLIASGLTAPGLSVQVEGEGSGTVPLDERHLLVQAVRAAFDELGGQPGGLRVHCYNRIPHGRGLGSSSAAICAGLIAARALVENGEKLLDDERVLDLATRIEGHPDNVAPCLSGGLTIAWMAEQATEVPWVDEASGAGDCQVQDTQAQHAQARNIQAQNVQARNFQAPNLRAQVLRLDPDPAVIPVVFIPAQPLATSVARGLLPAEVPHRDAAFNAGRAGLLVAALTQPGLSPHHRCVLLYEGTRDRLHQSYRAPAMPGSAALVEQLSALRLPATVSGAGPTVLALATTAGQARQVLGYAPADVTAMIAAVAADGVLVGR
jgi:homoserine kinase